MTIYDVREWCNCTECTQCGLIEDTEDCGKSHDAFFCDFHNPDTKQSDKSPEQRGEQFYVGDTF